MFAFLDTKLEDDSAPNDCMEKQKISELDKKFVACFGTRKLITVFTRAFHWSLASLR